MRQGESTEASGCVQSPLWSQIRDFSDRHGATGGARARDWDASTLAMPMRAWSLGHVNDAPIVSGTQFRSRRSSTRADRPLSRPGVVLHASSVFFSPHARHATTRSNPRASPSS